MAAGNPTKEPTMTSLRFQPTESETSRRELAATWLAVAIVAAMLALAAYWAGGAVLDGFRSLGRV
jgi:hypothetical protein